MDTNSAAASLGYGLGQLLANSLGFLVVGLVLTLVVFLVVRWFWLWYWKVHVQVALLRQQVELLQAIAASTQRLEERGRPLPAGSPAFQRQPTLVR